MRNFCIALIVVASFIVAGPALAGFGSDWRESKRAERSVKITNDARGGDADARSAAIAGAIAKQGQQQKQSQDTAQANAQNTTIDASDRSVQRIEAKSIPVASAAPVFASACSAGVSAQTMGFGGSLASTNPMCDLALAAEMARSVGNNELAYELSMEAATFARARTNVVRRFGQWIPFIGQLW